MNPVGVSNSALGSPSAGNAVPRSLQHTIKVHSFSHHQIKFGENQTWRTENSSRRIIFNSQIDVLRDAEPWSFELILWRKGSVCGTEAAGVGEVSSQEFVFLNLQSGFLGIVGDERWTRGVPGFGGPWRPGL